MDALGATRRCALIALITLLFMSVGVTSAFAGGRDYGSATGHQNSKSDESWNGEGGHKQSKHEGDSSDEWSDESDSSWDDKGSDQSGKDCKKNESPPIEQKGEQGQPQTPPVSTGGEYGGKEEHAGKGEEGEHGNKGEKGEHGNKGEKGEHGNKGKGEEKPGPGPGPGPGPTTTPTTPVVTPAVPVTPAPVTAVQTPNQGGEVQGEVQETPVNGKGGSSQGESGNGSEILAENTTAAASESGGLASTGFDAWLVALLGVACVGGSAVLLRRTRRS
jgi:LPXTG-motif cell wall-anchored protein